MFRTLKYVRSGSVEIFTDIFLTLFVCNLLPPPLPSPVHLSTAPANDVNISIDDPTNQTLPIPSFIQFTPENYAEPQVIRVCADEDAR